MTDEDFASKHPPQERYRDLVHACRAADQPCEHPELAEGENAFCLKCLSCRAGLVFLELRRIANERKARK